MNIIYCVSLWRDYCNDNRDKDEDKMPMMIVMLGLELWLCLVHDHESDDDKRDHGRRSVSDSGTRPPIFGPADTITNVPQYLRSTNCN